MITAKVNNFVKRTLTMCFEVYEFKCSSPLVDKNSTLMYIMPIIINIPYLVVLNLGIPVCAKNITRASVMYVAISITIDMELL